MAASDVLRKELFELPQGVIYLDGNSLGPLPKGAMDRAMQTMKDEWGAQLIRAWNTADWISLPQRVGDRIAKVIGAEPGSVTTGDTLSIKVYQALAAALVMRPDRRVILSDSGNFPSDLYMASGLIETIGKDYVLKVVAPEEVADAIDASVAAVMLTHVDYRSGRMHDMAAVTAKAHQAGAVMIWDLAHSAGAVPVKLAACDTEFAVGCSYKYLNGGPGAPAFIYVRPDIVEDARPALSGWMGHEAPFLMDQGYRPAMSTERMRVGTPPIIQLSVLDKAMDIWDDIDMRDIRAASIDLSQLFVAEVEKRCPQLTLVSPRDPQQRGSQASFAFDNGYAAIQALIDRGVIGDFRAPNIMRFGFTPLYLDSADILAAVDVIEKVMTDRLWDDPQYRKVSRVT
jgi:kynureninase